MKEFGDSAFKKNIISQINLYLKAFDSSMSKATTNKNSDSENIMKNGLSGFDPFLINEALNLQNQKNRINYCFPASIELAEIHSKASKFGFCIPSVSNRSKKCACCYKNKNNEEFPLCYPTTIDQHEKEKEKEIWGKDFKLKNSIVSYFLLVKMLITYLSLHFILCDGFNLYKNYVNGQDCEDMKLDACGDLFFNYASSLNQLKNLDHLQVQEVLNLVTVILSIIFFFFYRKAVYYNHSKMIDEVQHKEQEFTLLVDNIPIVNILTSEQLEQQRKKKSQSQTFNYQVHYRQHLEDFFQQKIRSWLEGQNWNQSGQIQSEYRELEKQTKSNIEKSIVPSISLCYDLTSLQILQETRLKLIKTHSETLKENDLWKDGEDNEIMKCIRFLNKQQVQLSKKFINDNSSLFILTNFVGKALISFQCQHFRQFIFEQAQKDSSFLQLHGNRLQVERASSPSDIYWRNMKIASQVRKERTIFSFSVLALVLLFVFIILGFLIHLHLSLNKESAEGNEQAAIKGKILSIFMGILPFFMNHWLKELILYLTKGEKHTTKSKQTLSITVKIILYQFINTALLYFIVSEILRDPLMSIFGLVPQISITVIIACSLNLIIGIINPPAIAREIAVSKYNLQDQQVKKFQIQLNQEFEYAEFNLPSQYADYLVIFLTVMFYAYLIPILILFVIGFFIIQYWVDKYNLFKRSKIKHDFNFLLTRKIIKIYESSIFIYSVGTVYFIYQIHGRVGILSWAMLIISVLYFIFVLFGDKQHERWIFGKYEVLDKITYNECAAEHIFEQTYWTSNPATLLLNELDVKGKNKKKYQCKISLAKTQSKQI